MKGQSNLVVDFPSMASKEKEQQSPLIFQRENNMINILIADDHPIVRRGLRELIEDENDLRVECEASSRR